MSACRRRPSLDRAGHLSHSEKDPAMNRLRLMRNFQSLGTRHQR